jgi:hypothetical protein
MPARGVPLEPTVQGRWITMCGGRQAELDLDGLGPTVIALNAMRFH